MQSIQPKYLVSVWSTFASVNWKSEFAHMNILARLYTVTTKSKFAFLMLKSGFGYITVSLE